jgi:hypothetical protein
MIEKKNFKQIKIAQNVINNDFCKDFKKMSFWTSELLSFKNDRYVY